MITPSLFIHSLYPLNLINTDYLSRMLWNSPLVVGYFAGLYMTIKSFIKYKNLEKQLASTPSPENQSSSPKVSEKIVLDNPLPVNAHDFDYVSVQLRDFFKNKGFIETHTQNQLSILTGTEYPWTVTRYKFNNQVWPLPQTGQLNLEHEILNNSSFPGCFCFSTSYRQEPDPIPDRHDLIFPMFEFEMRGDISDLIILEKELLEHLGYATEKFTEGKYTDITEKYKTETIDHVHETQLYEEYGPTYFLTNFPEHTSPYWNIKRNPETNNANKVNIILSGQETISSGEREICPDAMRDRFDTISKGEYKQKIYDLFGKERTELELNGYLEQDFIERSGAGIGLTRLIRSMNMEGLIPDNSVKVTFDCDPKTSISI